MQQQWREIDMLTTLNFALTITAGCAIALAAMSALSFRDALALFVTLAVAAIVLERYLKKGC